MNGSWTVQTFQLAEPFKIEIRSLALDYQRNLLISVEYHTDPQLFIGGDMG